jgi:predicted ATPase
MYALFHTAMFAYFHRGDYAVTRALLDELIALADEKGSAFWKADGQMLQGCLLALTGKPSDAVHLITTAIAAWRSTGATLFVPGHLSCVARAYSELGDFDDAWRCLGEAMTAIEATKETWCEAEVNRIAGEIALRSPAGDLLEAQAHFERALAIARQQRAKSWELRASMSLARLRRNQGKVREARELLAPVYGWFTEG